MNRQVYVERVFKRPRVVRQRALAKVLHVESAFCG
jgi:hypothetical protein